MAILWPVTGTPVVSTARSDKLGNARLVRRRNAAVVVPTRRVFIKCLTLKNMNIQALAPYRLPGGVARLLGSSHGHAT
jgi:hypothetical protein